MLWRKTNASQLTRHVKCGKTDTIKAVNIGVMGIVRGINDDLETERYFVKFYGILVDMRAFWP